MKYYTLLALFVLSVSCNYNRSKSNKNEENKKCENIDEFSLLCLYPLDSILCEYYHHIKEQLPSNELEKRIFIIDFFHKDTTIMCEISSTWSIPEIRQETNYSIIAYSKIRNSTIVFVSKQKDSLGYDLIKMNNWINESINLNPENEYLANVYNIKNAVKIFVVNKKGVFISCDYDRYFEQNDDYFNSMSPDVK